MMSVVPAEAQAANISFMALTSSFDLGTPLRLYHGSQKISLPLCVPPSRACSCHVQFSRKMPLLLSRSYHSLYILFIRDV